MNTTRVPNDNGSSIAQRTSLRKPFLSRGSTMSDWAPPSAGFYDRLTTAMQDWERRRGRVGRAGGQAELLKRMREKFGDHAPTQAAVSKWFRQEAVPGMDGVFFLAYALEVNAAWLGQNEGKMRDGEAGDPEVHQASPPPEIIDRVPNGVPVVPTAKIPRVETGDDVRRITGRPRRNKRDDRTGS